MDKKKSVKTAPRDGEQENTQQLISCFQNLANSIRAKGVTGTMTPEQMPAKIGSLVPESICGVTIDSIFGNVSNGRIQQPQGGFTFGSSDVIQIGENALKYTFRGRPNLTQVNLPNLTTIQANGMFQFAYDCTNLTSVSMPNLTTVLDAGLQNAFQGCTSLTTVMLNNLSSCGLQNAFSGCTSLTTVMLNNLSSCGNNGLDHTFYGCTSLTTVRLNNLSSCGTNGLYYTFYGCTSLQVVDFRNATSVPPLPGTATFGNVPSTCKIVVPDALYNTWIAATNWSNASIKAMITKLSDYSE